MTTISREEFEELVAKVVAQLPKPYLDKLKNVAIIIEDEPSPEQRRKLALRNDQTLFGLYEGVPLSERQGTLKILPDKITVFKIPLESTSQDVNELFQRLGRTIWHEVAHYYGLDHEQIRLLEEKERKPQDQV